MATMDRFRFGMRDALANGLPLTDALGQGISAAAAADEAGRKKGFQRSITDAIGRGLTATQAIGDALGAGYTADYGVKGMRKGVRKAAPATGGRKPARSAEFGKSLRSHGYGGGTKGEAAYHLEPSGFEHTRTSRGVHIFEHPMVPEAGELHVKTSGEWEHHRPNLRTLVERKVHKGKTLRGLASYASRL